MLMRKLFAQVESLVGAGNGEKGASPVRVNKSEEEGDAVKEKKSTY